MRRKSRSLRAMADKWLFLRPDTRVHVTRVAQGARKHRSCVYVSAVGAVGESGMFFFRHDDGSWYIFPPDEARPALGVDGRDV
ncbi:hypothetical protein C7410_12569 [Paraburkholderia silvatlantica]|uniref:Uncharacterized protein n=1 Tax=Paraburkholderia silvatlantica TaxID=321895 RepID=A0A2V4TV87_9BURK|nr:hypothetical protein C7410_12569 [Paraburkholderia silvatlantica]TDQ98430.1 hypothetical protein C7412_10554 [Paraburkholderia silvatlantica]